MIIILSRITVSVCKRRIQVEVERKEGNTEYCLRWESYDEYWLSLQLSDFLFRKKKTDKLA